MDNRSNRKHTHAEGVPIYNVGYDSLTSGDSMNTQRSKFMFNDTEREDLKQPNLINPCNVVTMTTRPERITSTLILRSLDHVLWGWYSKLVVAEQRASLSPAGYCGICLRWLNNNLVHSISNLSGLLSICVAHLSTNEETTELAISGTFKDINCKVQDSTSHLFYDIPLLLS